MSLFKIVLEVSTLLFAFPFAQGMMRMVGLLTAKFWKLWPVYTPLCSVLISKKDTEIRFDTEEKFMWCHRNTINSARYIIQNLYCLMKSPIPIRMGHLHVCNKSLTHVSDSLPCPFPSAPLILMTSRRTSRNDIHIMQKITSRTIK